MDSVIYYVCRSCRQDRPESDMMKVDTNSHQCKICVMMSKPVIAGPLMTRAEIDERNRLNKEKLNVAQAPKLEQIVNPTCPGCLKIKTADKFMAGKHTYRFCNECRANEIALNDERTKNFIGGLFSGMDKTLGRCINCGFTGELERDFPVGVTEPTGFKPYCIKKCEGRKK